MPKPTKGRYTLRGSKAGGSKAGRWKPCGKGEQRKPVIWYVWLHVFITVQWPVHGAALGHLVAASPDIARSQTLLPHSLWTAGNCLRPLGFADPHITMKLYFILSVAVPLLFYSSPHSADLGHLNLSRHTHTTSTPQLILFCYLTPICLLSKRCHTGLKIGNKNYNHVRKQLQFLHMPQKYANQD